MKNHRWLTVGASAVLIALLSSIAVYSWHIHQRHAEYRRLYNTVAAAIPLHSRRADVERYLSTRGIAFSRGIGPGSLATDDFVRICSLQQAPYLHCGSEQPMVLIRFAENRIARERRRHPTVDNIPLNPVYPTSDAADDEVTGLSYELSNSSDI